VSSLEHLFSSQSQWIKGSPIDEFMSKQQITREDMIYLSVGTPGKECIPFKELQHVSHQLYNQPSIDFLDYGDSTGNEQLRQWIMQHHAKEGMHILPEELMITSGSTQGFDLCCKSFLNKGDAVIMENPTYSNNFSTVQSYGANIYSVPVDENGIKIECLEQTIETIITAGETLKMVCVIPHAQNPSGVTLSLDRKVRLLELSEKYDFLIIEDDPYSETMFDEKIPTMFSMDHNHQHVIYLNSFSKMIAPGLRVGYALGNEQFINKLVQYKQLNDSCSSSFSQQVIVDFFNEYSFSHHLSFIQQQYQRKKDAMISSLKKHFRHANVTWTNPKGGLFLWMTMPNIDTTKLLSYAIEEGVLYIPGVAFQSNNIENHHLRLCYSYCQEEKIDEAISRLFQAYKTYQNQ